MKLIYLEKGVILQKDNPEYETFLESNYDSKYSLKMKNNMYCKKMKFAFKEALEYVKKGEEGSYAVIEEPAEKTDVDDNFDPSVDECDAVMGYYMKEYVYYSVAKINGEIVENFLYK